jgi:FAD/FMN-containing dehydrogenase
MYYFTEHECRCVFCSQGTYWVWRRVTKGFLSCHPSAANISDGITIHLSRLDRLLVTKDRSTVTIGPSSTWHRVYEELAPQGLVAAGGRVVTVHVSGLVLGGKPTSY